MDACALMMIDSVLDDKFVENPQHTATPIVDTCISKVNREVPTL